jgi:hypothetical protein
MLIAHAVSACFGSRHDAALYSATCAVFVVQTVSDRVTCTSSAQPEADVAQAAWHPAVRALLVASPTF